MNWANMEGEPDAEAMSGSFLAINIGGTDAYLVSEWNAVLVARGLSPVVMGDRRFEQGDMGNLRLPPGMNTRACSFPKATLVASGANSLMPTARPINKSEFIRISKKDLILYLVGWVGYKDGVGNYRQTAYCRQWDPDSARFVGTDDPDYEYAD